MDRIRRVLGRGLRPPFRAIKRRWKRFSTRNLPTYNLTICDEPAFVWFRVAKVGTRSIYHHLAETTSLPLSVDHSYRYPWRASNHRDHFKFAFVRNPWDRLVSCWANKVVQTNHWEFEPAEYARMQRFENFVGWVKNHDLTDCDCHFRMQSSLIDLREITFLGRFETFYPDFCHVCRVIGVPLPDPAPRNSSRRKAYPHYYDADLAERVGRIYERDIRLFGYRYEAEPLHI